jgi:hypothetical protein
MHGACSTHGKDVKYIQNFSWKGRDHLGDPGSGLGEGPMADPYENGNERLVFIKCGEFDWLSNFKLLKNYSATWI